MGWGGYVNLSDLEIPKCNGLRIEAKLQIRSLCERTESMSISATTRGRQHGAVVLGVFACVTLALAVVVSALADADVYPTNELGMSYGSAVHAETYEDEPDLIAVIATSGEQGYVRRDDLHEAERPASTPDEAARFMDEKFASLSEATAARLNDMGYDITADDLRPLVGADGALDVVLQTWSSGNGGGPVTLSDGSTVALDDVARAYLQAQEDCSTSIPVYESDGITVIGEFMVR